MPTLKLVKIVDFLMQIEDMAQNSIFLDIIDLEAMKFDQCPPSELPFLQ